MMINFLLVIIFSSFCQAQISPRHQNEDILIRETTKSPSIPLAPANPPNIKKNLDSSGKLFETTTVNYGTNQKIRSSDTGKHEGNIRGNEFLAFNSTKKMTERVNSTNRKLVSNDSTISNKNNRNTHLEALNTTVNYLKDSETVYTAQNFATLKEHQNTTNNGNHNVENNQNDTIIFTKESTGREAGDENNKTEEVQENIHPNTAEVLKHEVSDYTQSSTQKVPLENRRDDEEHSTSHTNTSIYGYRDITHHHHDEVYEGFPHDLPEDTKPDDRELYIDVIQENNIKNLCRACLCDPKQINVYCRHEHTINELSHHLVIVPEIIPKTATSLHIEGFEKVTITSHTFGNEDLELRRIEFENIQNLELMRESLYFSERAKSNRETAVVFTGCNIIEMPPGTLTQNASSKAVHDNTHLENTRFLSLYLKRCNIQAIRSYALFQARLLYFNMSQTKVDLLEKHSFHVDIYEDWVVEYSSLPRLKQHAICIKTHMIVIFSNNYFSGLENRSLEIKTSNQVLFEYNQVAYLGTEALMGIVPTERGANFVFLNNTVEDAANKSLVISKKYLLHERKVLNNKFNILCDCNFKENFQPLMGITAESNHYENQTYNAVLEDSFCKLLGSTSYTEIKDYINDSCKPLPLPIIISAVTVTVVVIITIIVCIVCSRQAAKAKEEANYLGECCYSHSFSTLNTENRRIPTPLGHTCVSADMTSNMHAWVVAVPEVKTYQETEDTMYVLNLNPVNKVIDAWILISLLLGTNGNIYFENARDCGGNVPDFCHCEFTRIQCDCEGGILQFQDSIVQNQNSIQIMNCKRLTIEAKSLLAVGPVAMTLERIDDLRMKAGSFELDAFHNPRINLTMKNTIINVFPSHTFSVSKSEMSSRVLTGNNAANAKTAHMQLSILNTTINELQSNAFSNFIIDSLTITNSTMKLIHHAAFNNSFSEIIQIMDTKFGVLADNAFLLHNLENNAGNLKLKNNTFEGNLTIFLSGTINNDVYITNNKFGHLLQSPWNLRVGRNVFITQNYFQNIPSNGMNMKVKNRVTINNNTFLNLQSNALQLVTPEASTNKDMEIRLTDNIIHTYEFMSLCLSEEYDANNVVIRNNRFQQECSCDLVKSIALGLGNENLTALMLYEDKVHQQWLQTGKCVLNESPTTINLYLVKECLKGNRVTTVLLLVFAVILITMAVFVIVAWRKIQKKRKNPQMSSDYQSFSAPAPPSQGQTPWSFVQPDSRTYQETEIHILFDKAKEIEVLDNYDNNRESLALPAAVESVPNYSNAEQSSSVQNIK
ncbi:hypothetical protein SK128_003910 [Halocaridina rubra]|uniref:Right handed beta helix domain-containing protein n=1 Tax=Halocaridina rubra TaxID=373956 RepID=A0AAN8X8Y9_HALRR